MKKSTQELMEEFQSYIDFNSNLLHTARIQNRLYVQLKKIIDGYSLYNEDTVLRAIDDISLWFSYYTDISYTNIANDLKSIWFEYYEQDDDLLLLEQIETILSAMFDVKQINVDVEF
jgi:hypothetical protein